MQLIINYGNYDKFTTKYEECSITNSFTGATEKNSFT